MTMSNNIMGQFGDTTLTKVFVGGLAWETPKEAMREHFEKYGEILEAVIITEKITGRSKGYGFVTFKEAEAAKKACEDATPIINGRRANCNLASLGARRPRSSSTTPLQPPQQGSNAWTKVHVSCTTTGKSRAVVLPSGDTAFALPSSTTSSTRSFLWKLSYNGGTYMNGHFSQVYPGQPIVGANTLMPMYPFYHYHQSQTMGLPGHIFSPTTTGPIATVPAIMSKPASIAPNSGAVGAGDQNFKKVG
uniref:RRM domain-containing protein n=1 Tax=Fagus sylvatica TaxID=28930 RepID=A0A2N9IKB0_FAGSY